MLATLLWLGNCALEIKSPTHHISETIYRIERSWTGTTPFLQGRHQLKKVLSLINMTALSLLLLAVALVNVVESDFGLTAILTTASTAISAGASVGSMEAAIRSSGFTIHCGIEVENWTKFTLTHYSTDLPTGAITVPPTTILPGRKEGMSVRKTSDAATGTWGTTSWYVEGQSRRVVVMWSVPWSYARYSNTLGVGITSRRDSSNWFNDMYYGRQTRSWFNRQEYYYSSSRVIYRDNLIEVSGTMGTSRKTVAKIIVRPINNDDLAPRIKEALQLN